MASRARTAFHIPALRIGHIRRVSLSQLRLCGILNGQLQRAFKHLPRDGTGRIVLNPGFPGGMQYVVAGAKVVALQQIPRRDRLARLHQRRVEYTAAITFTEPSEAPKQIWRLFFAASRDCQVGVAIASRVSNPLRSDVLDINHRENRFAWSDMWLDSSSARLEPGRSQRQPRRP
jgi:hypothetical protein